MSIEEQSAEAAVREICRKTARIGLTTYSSSPRLRTAEKSTLVSLVNGLREPGSCMLLPGGVNRASLGRS